MLPCCSPSCLCTLLCDTHIIILSLSVLSVYVCMCLHAGRGQRLALSFVIAFFVILFYLIFLRITFGECVCICMCACTCVYP